MGIEVNAIARRWAAAAGATALLVTALRAVADDTQPDVILARTRPDVVLVWKINATLSALAEKHLSSAALGAALTARGEAIMAARAAGAQKPSASVTLKLMYFHDAADPRYKIETLAGISPVGSMSASAGALQHDAQWRRLLARGKTPSALHVTLDRSALANVTSP